MNKSGLGEDDCKTSYTVCPRRNEHFYLATLYKKKKTWTRLLEYTEWIESINKKKEKKRRT